MNNKIKKAKMLLLELQSIKEHKPDESFIDVVNLISEALKDAEDLAELVLKENEKAA